MAGQYDIQKIQFTGFLAQEVEKAAKQINYDFSGVDVPKNDKDFMDYATVTLLCHW